MAGLFGNRFDTMSALDDALYKESLQVGQLSSYGVGQMAAYQDGRMGNPFAAAVNDLMSPEMQKQKILDELQAKHPNPDTPEELNALANDLFANGFGDMGLKVKEAATNLVSATADVLKANEPSADLFKNLESTFKGQIMSADYINDYLIKIGRPELAQPFKKGTNGQNITEYNNERKRYTKDMENLISAWAGSYKYDGSTKQDIATLRGSDDAMLNAFVEYIKVNGNKDVADTMLGLIFQGTVNDTGDRIEEIKITDGAGEVETLSLDEPYVKREKARIDQITNMETLQKQIDYQQRFLETNPNKKQTQILLQLLKARQLFLMSQSTSLDSPVNVVAGRENENATVLNDWIT
tara:strand:- start:1985 stop:3043 length:1059 start_codon:yes stop_codon:yes gene_type:complete